MCMYVCMYVCDLLNSGVLRKSGCGGGRPGRLLGLAIPVCVKNRGGKLCVVSTVMGMDVDTYFCPKVGWVQDMGERE